MCILAGNSGLWVEGPGPLHFMGAKNEEDPGGSMHAASWIFMNFSVAYCSDFPGLRALTKALINRPSTFLRSSGESAAIEALAPLEAISSRE